MNSLETPSSLLDAFPAFADVDSTAKSDLLESSRIVQMDAGFLVFEPGQACERFVLMQSGTIRVHLLDEEGHQIVLYRIRRGETCILTTAALLGAIPYMAYAVTETAVTATVFPAAAFGRIMARSSGFRSFVFAAHARRIVGLMEVISDVAFRRVQVRLARCLLQRSNGSGLVRMTHDAVAVEIGTAREVVSRNLKALEREGCVKLDKGSLTIVDGRRLAAIAEGPKV